MFLEECINIVKNNPTFPVSAFEILLKYKNDPEVIKIFNKSFAQLFCFKTI